MQLNNTAKEKKIILMPIFIFLERRKLVSGEVCEQYVLMNIRQHNYILTVNVY